MAPRRSAVALVALVCVVVGCGKSPFVGGWRQKDDALGGVLLIRKNGTGKSTYYSMPPLSPENIKNGTLPERVKKTSDFTWKSRSGNVEIAFTEGDPGPDLVLMLRPDGTLVSKSLHAKDAVENEYTSFPDVEDK